MDDLHGSSALVLARGSLFFFPDLKAVRFKDKGVSAAKYSFVGNLMIDSVPICGSRSEMKARFGVPENENVVSFPAAGLFEYQMATLFH